MPIFGLRSVKVGMEKFQGCGNGLVQLATWKVVSVDARVDVFPGAFMMSEVVLFLAVMGDRQWCRRSGRRDGRSIDFSLDSFILFESLNLRCWDSSFVYS